MVEEWNIGIMGIKFRIEILHLPCGFPAFHNSSIPLFPNDG
jgi:hypothetical protein